MNLWNNDLLAGVYIPELYFREKRKKREKVRKGNIRQREKRRKVKENEEKVLRRKGKRERKLEKLRKWGNKEKE